MQAHLEKLEAEGRLPQGICGLTSAIDGQTPRSPKLSARVGGGDRWRTGKAIRPRGRGVHGARGDHGCGALVPALPPAASEDQGDACGWMGWRGRSRSAATAGEFPTSAPQTAHDLWFGQGFCHGQDRLWQLDLYRRIGSGRLSEIAGRGRPVGPTA